MRIAVPTESNDGLDSLIVGHFGRAPWFTVVDTESGAYESIPNNGSHFGGAMTAPELLHRNGVELIVCHGLGTRAIAVCQELGIDVCIGEQTTVQGVLDAHNTNQLRPATDADGCTQGHHE